jgi:hypothetical protein
MNNPVTSAVPPDIKAMFEIRASRLAELTFPKSSARWQTSPVQYPASASEFFEMALKPKYVPSPKPTIPIPPTTRPETSTEFHFDDIGFRPSLVSGA